MIKCTNYKSYNKGSLLGFADLLITEWAGGIEIPGCKLFQKDGRRWLQLPSREYKDDEGNIKYAPLFHFRDKEVWQKFMEEAKRAVEEYCASNQESSPKAVEEELPF
jgi:hypothetical protein